MRSGPSPRARLRLSLGCCWVVRIVEVLEKTVVTDLNPPGCGQAVRLEVELVTILEPDLSWHRGTKRGGSLMLDTNSGRGPGSAADRLLAYAADLELEVDRLRRHGTFIEREATATLLRILRLCSAPGTGTPLPTLGEVESTARALLDVVKDLHDLPGYHPAHDQVVAIAIRPLALQVFRWQQRLTGTHDVVLRLELETDHVEWFPARLRHILDNLLAHALRHRDTTAGK